MDSVLGPPVAWMKSASLVDSSKQYGTWPLADAIHDELDCPSRVKASLAMGAETVIAEPVMRLERTELALKLPVAAGPLLARISVCRAKSA